MASVCESVSPEALPQPGRPASSGSVTDHSHGFGAPCGPGFSLNRRTLPMMRPSTSATPSVPGGHSGKVRRHVMLGLFTGMAPICGKEETGMRI